MANVASTIGSFAGDLVRAEIVWDDATRAIKR